MEQQPMLGAALGAVVGIVPVTLVGPVVGALAKLLLGPYRALKR